MTDFRKLCSVIFTGCVLAGMSACNTVKKQTGAATGPVLPKIEISEYLSHKLDYTTFSGKADLQINKDGQSQNLNVNLRMQKDKRIWASVTALGLLEAARAYITPDSLFAVNRMDRSAYALSYEAGRQLLQTDVPFSSLQNLIIGNPLITDVPVSKTEETDSTMLITQQQGNFTQVLTYDKRTQVLRHLFLSASEPVFTCDVDYAEYKPLALKQPFAFSRQIAIHQADRNITLQLDFGKVQLDVPVDMNFSIPASYELRQIKK